MQEGTGDCYLSAAHSLMDFSGEVAAVVEPVLVHADVISGDQLGNRIIGHAWIEVGDVVFDFSNGRRVVSRKEKYYAIVKPIKIRKYSYEQACDLMVRTGHSGPYIEKENGSYMNAKEVGEYYRKIWEGKQ